MVAWSKGGSRVPKGEEVGIMPSPAPKTEREGARLHRRLEQATSRAPKELAGKMQEALDSLSKRLPEAKSGEVLSSRVNW